MHCFSTIQCDLPLPSRALTFLISASQRFDAAAPLSYPPGYACTHPSNFARSQLPCLHPDFGSMPRRLCPLRHHPLHAIALCCNVLSVLWHCVQTHVSLTLQYEQE